MSRTLKDMYAGVREHRHRTVLSRQRARRCARTARTFQGTEFGRHGRRMQERRLSNPTEKEEAI